jgi:hypothetical protein
VQEASPVQEGRKKEIRAVAILVVVLIMFLLIREKRRFTYRGYPSSAILLMR